MAPTREQIEQALQRVPYPGYTRDVVSLGVIASVKLDGSAVRVEVDLGSGNPAVAAPLEAALRTELGSLPGVDDVRIDLRGADGGSPLLKVAKRAPSSAAAAGGLDTGLVPEVEHIVAVASGKGGVGKSTVAVNLAVSLARQGRRVGLLDADIYGPSIPLMMGVDEAPSVTPERRILPFEQHGVRLMSLGFLVERDSAVIWRGPMVMKALDELLRNVEWGALDVLVVDMPPGTGDAQLTLSQRVSLAGAVIVTTPQDVALADARKGVAMFRKVGVPVLGIVENMSYFQCPHCAERTAIFGDGGGRREAERLGVPLLGELPLDPATREGGDQGRPVAIASPDSAQAEAFARLATGVWETLEVPAAPGEDAEKEGLLDRFRRTFQRDA